MRGCSCLVGQAPGVSVAGLRGNLSDAAGKDALIMQIRMFPARPDAHTPVDRRSKVSRRVGADIVRALSLCWPTAGEGWVWGVVRPGRLALAGQWFLRAVRGLCG